MDSIPGIDLLNRQTERINKRRTSFWLSVVLPFIASVLVVGVLVYLIARSGMGSAGAWADTALTFLMLPMLLLCLIPLALVGVLTYGTFWLIGWLPGPLGTVETGVRRVNRGLSRGIDVGMRPLITVKAFLTAIRVGLSRLQDFTGRGEWHE